VVKLIAKAAVLFLLFLPQTVFAGEPAESLSEAETPISSVGERVPPMDVIGERAAKATIYVIGGVLLLSALIRKFFPQGVSPKRVGDEPIRLEARKTISKDQTVFIIQVDGERLVIGSTPKSMTTLARLPQDKEETVEVKKDFHHEPSKVTAIS